MSAPVTVFTKSDGRLTKRFYKDANGDVTKDREPTLSAGTFNVRQVNDLGELAALLHCLTQAQAVAYGRPKTDAGRIVASAGIGGAPGAIARTREYFAWPAGAGVLMLDYDAPKDGTPPLTQEGLIEAMRNACPFLAGVGMLWRPSASSGVAGVGIKGQRLYIMIDEASHIPRIGKTIFDRLWLAGYGYTAIGSAGALFDRAPIDANVWRPEGLDYAATPVLDDGIERENFPAEVISGAVLCALDVTDLTAEDTAEVARLQAASRRAKENDAAPIRVAHAAKMRRNAISRGADLTDAEHDSAITTHCLPDAWPLRAPGGDVLTVGEILDDPDQWNEKRFADPVEVDCNDDRVAVAYLRNGSQSCIYSHLHGGMRYTFQRHATSADDFDRLPAALPRAAPLAGPMQRAACATADVRNGTNTTRPLTELGNAARLFDSHGDQFRFVSDAGKWLIWDGAAWRWDDGATVRSLAGNLPAAIYREGLQYLAEGDRFAQHARNSGTLKFINNAVTLLSHYQNVRVPLAMVDANPMVAGFDRACQVIDLASGSIRPATPSDYVTKTLGASAVGDAAKALRWQSFLRQIFKDDAELIDWMKRFCGYMLTGETREHLFVFCFGSGANGKSVFLDVLKHVVGDYARAIASETLCEAKRQAGGASPDLADLIGARLAVCGETEDNQVFAESLIKQLVGGDTMSVRPMYGNPIQFTPAIKLVMAGNHKPQVRGQDHGIWRRIRLVPFTQTFCAEDRDPHLIEKLKAETPHILAWMLEGCAAWRMKDLQDTPAAIIAATAEYQGEQDITGAWFEERTVPDQLALTPMADLYIDYRGWAIAAGLHPMTKVSLARIMETRGFKAVQQGKAKTRCRAGLRLAAAGPDDFPEMA